MPVDVPKGWTHHHTLPGKPKLSWDITGTSTLKGRVVDPPGPGEDAAAGYNVGDLVIHDPTDDIYVCVKCDVGISEWQLLATEVFPAQDAPATPPEPPKPSVWEGSVMLRRDREPDAS
jgi:hypothetical protein